MKKLVLRTERKERSEMKKDSKNKFKDWFENQTEEDLKEIALMLKGGGCKVLYSDGTIENSSIEWLKCG